MQDKRLKIFRLLWCALPVCFAGIVVLWHFVGGYILARMPGCLFFTVTGLLCPGCGNTRSVNALLQLDLLSSLRYNITPVVSLLIGGLAYGQLGFALWGKKVRLLPRRAWFWWGLGGCMLLYYFVRNLPVWPF